MSLPNDNSITAILLETYTYTRTIADISSFDVFNPSNLVELGFSNGTPATPILGTGSNYHDPHSFTVMAWIYWTPRTSGSQDLYGIVGGSIFLHLTVKESGHVHLGFYSRDLQSNTVIDTNRWYHITFVYEAGELFDSETTPNGTQRIYIDGILDASQYVADAFYGTNFGTEIDNAITGNDGANAIKVYLGTWFLDSAANYNIDSINIDKAWNCQLANIIIFN